jgi:hypothetical protein
MLDELGALGEWIDRPVFVDARGRLSSFEFDSLPFVPARAFVVSDVPAGMSRGGHAHRSGLQLMACLAGRVRVDLATRTARASTHCELDGPALLVKAGVFARQTYLSAGSALLVICSSAYHPGSYISDPEILAP